LTLQTASFFPFPLFSKTIFAAIPCSGLAAISNAQGRIMSYFNFFGLLEQNRMERPNHHQRTAAFQPASRFAATKMNIASIGKRVNSFSTFFILFVNAFFVCFQFLNFPAKGSYLYIVNRNVDAITETSIGGGSKGLEFSLFFQSDAVQVNSCSETAGIVPDPVKRCFYRVYKKHKSGKQSVCEFLFCHFCPPTSS
ncbi:MAG: hypothetical protein JXP39_08545, partial [Spirochaetales bacterium]|nr:hypothetical protein [Spirochaetales bacterium]